MNQNFFDELQPHSAAKLTILNNYVIPWMRKIVLGNRAIGRCLIIDGFAGEGLYGEEGKEVNGSPFVLLDQAIDFYKQAKANNWPEPRILLLFNEYNPDSFLLLKENIKKRYGLDYNEDKFYNAIPDYPSVKLALMNETFENVLISLLERTKGRMVPSFCFIDPYGFKDTPLQLIGEYLKSRSSEILLNFIYEETNRFIRNKNSKIREHLMSHFGVDTLDELIQLIEGKKSEERKKVIVNYYSKQLQEHAGYVLNFDIYKNGRTKMILFFGSNHAGGLREMKNSMWDIDGTGSYIFKKDTNVQDIHFDFIYEMEEEERLKKIGR
ncbi:MAG: three-Cys-motif partner protein TcmP [Bacillus sp. (in: Bacteria)]|nr:three-Cys-motif partner protein TcmP [Bacillus sp. (in: firmicutes)]